MKKYKVGMYGGDFQPFHMGHLNNILRASAICDELYVIISWSEKRDTIPKELRYRWILNSTRHIGNVKILLIEDKADSKESYNDSYWEQGAKDIKKAIGKHIDIVFCGDDYKNKNRFEPLYPKSKILYFNRDDVPISSTLIRNNPLAAWDYIPQVARSYYVKKVLVIGGESTGKSTLVQNLALYYNTNFVSEVGRDTCDYAGGEEYMIADDLIENLMKQKINVDEAVKTSNKLLFVDTDALTTKFYSDFLLKEGSLELDNCKKLADAINSINKWDLVLFLEPDGVEFVQDGTRSEEIKSDRIKYSEMIEALFKEANIRIYHISGDYLHRFEVSKYLIDNLILKKHKNSHIFYIPEESTLKGGVMNV